VVIRSRDRVAARSIAVLKDGQARSGAFVASPNFPVYRYAWLRDGAFCAGALDVVGEREHAEAFHEWATRSIESNRLLIETAITRVAACEEPRPDSMPPARYTLDGLIERDGSEPWPNFQIDGYGIWLWALAEHLSGKPPSKSQSAAIELVARYLQATWRVRCWNCWEEFDGGEHASTLAAAFGGLSAASRLLEDECWAREASAVRTAVVEKFLHGDRFARGPADERLDGSLLWLAVPFGVLRYDDPRIRRTVKGIKTELRGPTGGVYRYRGDSYYGGGEWLLLASSLAWYEAVAGEGGSSDAHAWVRAQASGSGDLPEQVATHAQDPTMLQPWIDRWGPIATPLLWSHAMYLIAESAL